MEFNSIRCGWGQYTCINNKEDSQVPIIVQILIHAKFTTTVTTTMLDYDNNIFEPNPISANSIADIQSDIVMEIKNSNMIMNEPTCDSQTLLFIKQIQLLPFIIMSPLIVVFVFVRCGSNTTFSRSRLAIMFCDETSFESSIRIANLISINNCLAVCDPIPRIIIKLIVFVDIIDNTVDAGIIFNTVVDAVMKLVILMDICIIYFVLFIINAIMVISYLIGTIIESTKSIFTIIDTALLAKQQKKSSKQS